MPVTDNNPDPYLIRVDHLSLDQVATLPSNTALARALKWVTRSAGAAEEAPDGEDPVAAFNNRI